MDEVCAKLVLELLGAYWSSEIIRALAGEEEFKPVFIEGLYWHSIWVCGSGCEMDNSLAGYNYQEIAEKIFTAFKRSCWLESTMCGGREKIVVKIGDGTGKPEEFMLKCELLGLPKREEGEEDEATWRSWLVASQESFEAAV